MAGITGQPTPKPKNVKNPVPGEASAQEAAAFEAEVSSNPPAITTGAARQPAGVTAGPGAVDDPAEAEFQEFLAASGGQEAPAAGVADPAQAQAVAGDMSTMPEPEGLASLKEQFREGLTRIKNSFTVTPKESVGVLKQSGLFQDVRARGDGIEVKRPGRNGWEKFDRDKIEALGDALDLSRDVFEGLIENVGRLGGAAMGFASNAPAGAAAGTVAMPGFGTVVGGVSTGLAGSVPGAIAGGAGGAVAAKNAGDLVAQELLNIPRDPERNMVAENLLAAGFGAGFSWIGSSLARRAATRNLLKAEGDKSINAVMKQVSETIEDVDTVKSSGIVLDTVDGKFRLDPNIATGGTDPEAKATAKWLSDTDGYRNFVDDMGTRLKTAYTGIAERIGSDAGKRSEMGKDFVLTAKDVRKVEGKLIGTFRDLADKKLAGKAQPAPRSLQTLQAMKAELSDSSGKLTVDSILDKNPALTPAQAKTLVTRMQKVQSQLSRGTMQIDGARQLYDDLTGIIDNTSNSVVAKPYGRALIDLKNAVRDDWIDMIDGVLPPNQQTAYRQSLGRYREIMGATDSLGRVLDSENISKDVLSKQLFEGAKSFEFMRSAKTLIQETNPELWENLTNEYFQRQMRSAMSEVVERGADGAERTVRKFDWNKIAGNWKKLDPRIQNELAVGTNIPQKGLEALMNLGQRFQNSTVEQLSKEPSTSSARQLVKNVISATWGGGAAKGTAAVSMLQGVGKNEAMMKWLQSGDNLERVLRESKGLSPNAKREITTFMMNWTPKAVIPVTRAPIRRSAEDEKQ